MDGHFRYTCRRRDLCRYPGLRGGDGRVVLSKPTPVVNTLSMEVSCATPAAPAIIVYGAAGKAMDTDCEEKAKTARPEPHKDVLASEGADEFSQDIVERPLMKTMILQSDLRDAYHGVLVRRPAGQRGPKE
eukprot:15970163-Heterocapsa_arctica.AAC.1